jgi:hypothetical protein
MPRITDINNPIEKKIDLTPFFKEEAFITIKRMSKYQFTLLLNRSRSGYSAKLYELMTEWRENNPDGTMTNKDFDDMKKSIGVEESEERIKSDSENNRNYYEFSIMETKHNFTGENNELLPINGGWFYDSYSGLVDDSGRVLDDFLVGEIVTFNNTGITLGE